LPSTPLNYKLCHISISDKFWPLNESIQSERNPSAWILKYCSRRKFVVWACYLGWIKFIGILSDWDMLTERDRLLVNSKKTSKILLVGIRWHEFIWSLWNLCTQFSKYLSSSNLRAGSNLFFLRATNSHPYAYIVGGFYYYRERGFVFDVRNWSL
jgi:hypothetical protein